MALKLTPTDAEQLIGLLRQSVEGNGAGSTTSAVHMVDASSDDSFAWEPFRISDQSLQRLRTAQVALQAEIVNLGSLPPSPDTFRGKIGLAAIRLVERLTWWQTSQWKQVAYSQRKVTQLHTEAIEHLSHRILELERLLAEMADRTGRK
jgi:hypothetical protein